VTCEEALGSAAVALLGGDRVDADVEAHLGGCDSCRAELAGLQPLPGVLGRLDPADLALLDASAPAGTALLDRLLAAAARDRRRRRAAVLAVAAAVIALILVPGAIWAVSRLHTSAAITTARPAQISWSATDASTGISGKAQAWASAWGSDLSVSISGVRSGTQCTIVVVTKDGATQTAASWKASYAGTAQVRGNVAAPVTAIAGIEIVDDTGHVLLHL